MSDKKVEYTGGAGVFSLLGVLFVGLKLTGYIAWSWWLVLLPFYGPLLVVLVFIVLAAIILGIGEAFK